MSWNWQIFFVVALINTTLCLGQLVAQKIDEQAKRLPKRHSINPGTEQRFLYWQDFYTQTYGDLLGLIWLMNGFGHLLIADKISWPLWIVFIAALFITTITFLSVHLNNDRKPDWGFPKNGKISLGGISHLPYFSLNLGMMVVCIGKTFTGELSGVLLGTTIIGVLIWMTATIADYLRGHFDKPKKKILKLYN